ncbi:MAG: adenylate/guanylate cyclase domain-containing protein [Candidatus Limnocylindrales bacterium]
MDQPESREPELLSPDDAFARSVLLGLNRGMQFGRRFLRRLPSEPRCKLCASPFAGPGGWLMRRVGKGRWPKNPKYCASCFATLAQHRGGAEIECSLLFADVRGSTTLAEGMRPSEFRGLMDRFFETAARVLVAHDAIVDKFVGDEIIGVFIPALTGELHAARAIAAARALLAATRMEDAEPGLPIGAGVNTGVAFVGSVGKGSLIDLTAMGDPVNVTARLASAAGSGEILVTLAAAQAARLDETGLEHRALALKGKRQPTEVVVLPGPQTASMETGG